ncbi:MAG: hypothetical protein HN712_26535 [Gemmatimonadetes bacterium]|nr:hypothetical protein [Gemmatimonadota bacterium]MBT6145895.1 hypothetical protein [Gemmatimonadota bacterium]MBT7863899.1 hypothetical protein [Gemmatimonadota bacterium]
MSVRLRYYAVMLSLLGLVSSCALLGPRSSGLDGPPRLQAEFSSEDASAHLRWNRVRGADFLRYQIERSHSQAFDSETFEVVAEQADPNDTTYVDGGITGDRRYRYRVLAFYAVGKDHDKEASVASDLAEGGIFPFTETWSLPPGFLPTRVLVSGDVVSVVGAGAGFVARFDREGHEVGRWRFTSGLNACLETATLDGPSLATGPDGSIYVVHNVYEEGNAPLPRWTKFSPLGQLLWTKPLETVFVRHIVIDEEQILIESVSQMQLFDYDGVFISRHPVPPLMVSSLRWWQGSLASLVEPLGFDSSGWQAPRLVVYSGLDRQQTEAVYGRDPLSEDDRGAGLLRRPSDFAADERTGNLYVVNAGHDRVEVFRDAQFLTRWGRQGDGQGQFSFRGKAWVIDDLTSGTRHQRDVVAGGIAVDADGFVYIADTFNNRIQKFEP